VIQTVSKLHEEGSERNVSQHHASCILLCIQSLLQALHTSSGHLDSFYAHCAHQRTVRTLACNELEVSGRKWYGRNYIWYQTMAEWNSEWLNFCVKIEFVSFRTQSKWVCQRKFVFVFWHDTNSAREKGVFSIQSLDFQPIFNIASKVVISDC